MGDTQAARDWLAKEGDCAWTGQHGAQEMRRIALNALDELESVQASLTEKEADLQASMLREASLALRLAEKEAERVLWHDAAHAHLARRVKLEEALRPLVEAHDAEIPADAGDWTRARAASETEETK